MNHLKSLIISRFETLGFLFISMVLSLVLLSIRIKLNQSFFFLFLVWNLFLATIPYAITIYLSSKENIKTFVLIPWLVIWLLFLPNSPYIITDLLHLKFGATKLLWLDVLVITSFAINGLILYFLSIKDFENIIRKHFKKGKIQFVMISIFFLTSFGMYLGRFLRFNSWDIIKHPQLLFDKIFDILLVPSDNYEAWIFTLSFGTFLWLTYYLFINVRTKVNP